MKTINTEEQKAIALDVMKQYPGAQKVAVCSDGEAFITDESDQSVRNHANRNRSGKKLSYVEFDRSVIFADVADDESNSESKPEKQQKGKPAKSEKDAAVNTANTATDAANTAASDEPNKQE